MKPKWLDGFADSFSAWLLILAGICSLGIGLAEVLGLDEFLPAQLREPLSLTLILLGLLGAGVGLERVTSIRRLHGRLEKIELMIGRSRHAQFLRGVQEIYGNGARLVSTAERHIRVLVFGKRPKAPKEYAEAIVNRLQESKKAENPVKYDVVIATSFKSFTPEDKAACEERNRFYSEGGIDELVSVNAIDTETSIGFDVLIVDDKHASIAFSSVKGVKQVQDGILFENEPGIVREMVTWYEECVWRPSKEFSTAFK